MKCDKIILCERRLEPPGHQSRTVRILLRALAFVFFVAAAEVHADVVAAYECGESGTLAVRFRDKAAELTTFGPDGRMTFKRVLRQDVTADGFQYSDDEFVLRGRGGDATLLGLGGVAMASCKALRASS